MALKRSGIRTMLNGSSAMLLCAFASSAMAQTATADEDEPSAQVAADANETADSDIVITGSRIPRPDVVSNSPVNVVSAEEIRLTASTETEQILNSLPQVVAGFGAQSNNPGNGTATINLRNLGTVRTLVLLNGRRMVGSGTDGVVDINMIPPGLIQRVDVVTGGASAVYGSDAMAGVVNFILRDDFEGMEIDAQAGITEHGDSGRLNVDLTLGGNFADGRGNLVFYGNYFNREMTKNTARDHESYSFVEAVVNGQPTLVPGGNSVTPQGTIFGPGLVGRRDLNGNLIGPSGIFFADTGWRAYRTSDGYNARAAGLLQLPLERYQAAALGHYEFLPGVRAFVEATYAASRINSTLEPLPMSSSGFIPGFQLDLRNPYMDPTLREFLRTNLDQDGNNLVPLNINRRILESGPRISDQSRNFWRFVIGLKGDLTDRLNWEVYYNQGRNEVIDRQRGGIIIQRFADMFRVDPNDPFRCANGDPKCVVINPFGLNKLTPEMVNYYNPGLMTNSTVIEQKQAGASLAGTLFDLPAGDVGVALGAEYRKESSQFEPDFLYRSGQALSRSAGLQPTGGSYDVKEVFGELYVPILGNMTAINILAVEAGIRFSDYSTAGSVTSYKIGGEYSPFEGLKFRGLLQRAVRAPNIVELYSGATNTAPLATDFCNATPQRTSAERAFCLQLGVPANSIDFFQQENVQIRAITGGNPNLNVETSDTWSVGFVYQPAFVPNLQVTVDYYDIEIKNAIAVFGGGLAPTITACRASLSLSNPFCQPLTSRSADGQLFDVPLLNQNIANITSRGVDFRVDYRHDLGDLGRLSYFIAGNYLLENKFQGSPVVNPVDCAGFISGGSCGSANPHWRLTQRLTWNMDPVTVSLRHRYIGEVDDGRIAAAAASGAARPNLAVPTAKAIHYFDLSAFIDVTEQFTIYGTIDNVLDQEPPFFLNERQTYDALGRRFTVGVRTRF